MNHAIFLLYTIGLILYWLMPFIAWLLLKGQRDAPARCWFAGTASYAIAALLFVFQGRDPHWAVVAAMGAFATLMVLLLIESMLLEIRSREIRWRRWVLAAGANALLIAFLHETIGAEAARVIQLFIISAIDVVLIVLIARVARKHRSRALLIVVLMVTALVSTNLLRIWRSVM